VCPESPAKNAATDSSKAERSFGILKRLEFEWNRTNATVNKRKHGVSFGEAASIFGDALAVTYRDPIHSVGEER